MSIRALVAIVHTFLTCIKSANAAWAHGAVDDCQATHVGECLAKKGCQWFSYTGHCELCDKWFGEEQKDFVGCKHMDPEEYCQSVFSTAQQKSGGGVDVESASYNDAIRHYQVTQRSGAFDDPHQRISTCTVWCDSSTLPHKCSGQLQVKDAPRGVNYGGRFIPEKYLGLPGFPDLFKGISKPRSSRTWSLCDVNTKDAGIRMESFLERNIKQEQFVAMAKFGFNVIRLPLGYWNLIDPSTSPDGPPDAVRRWDNLHKIMPAQQYRKWIDVIFQFAEASKMMVMMDLHGAPGGQSGNQNTGCDFGLDSNFYFGTEKNIRLGLEAVDAMAKICAAKGKVCYGIELLSEPYGPVGHTESDPNMIMVRKLKSGGLGRHVLASFYDRAVRTARRHMDSSTPIMLMDWPSWLEAFWMRTANFSYNVHGRIVFSTHFYEFSEKPTTDQESARKAFLYDLNLVQDFYLRTGYEVLISEYSLSNHGSGSPRDQFDYNGFTDWFVHQCNQRGLGSMIWNFDSYWSAWGPVYKPRVGTTLVQWKGIWPSSPEPHNAVFVNSVLSAFLSSLSLSSSCSAHGENCTATKCCNSPGTQCYVKNEHWAVCKDLCQPGSIDSSELLKYQTPWSCKKLGPRASPRPAKMKIVEDTDENEQAKPFSFMAVMQSTKAVVSLVFVTVGLIMVVVFISTYFRKFNYEVLGSKNPDKFQERCEDWCNQVLTTHVRSAEALDP